MLPSTHLSELESQDGHSPLPFRARCLCLLCYKSAEDNIRDFIGVNLVLIAIGLVVDALSTWLAPDDGLPRVKELTSIANDVIGLVGVLVMRLLVSPPSLKGLSRAKTLSGGLAMLFVAEIVADLYLIAFEGDPLDELSHSGRTVRLLDVAADALWAWSFMSGWFLFDWAIHDFYF